MYIDSVTHPFCCIYEQHNSIRDPDARCDFVGEIHMAFERDKILDHFLPRHIKTYAEKQNHPETPAVYTYLVYPWCWKGKICLWSQAEPLWQGYSWYQLPSVEKQSKTETMMLQYQYVFLKQSFLVTISCILPSLREWVTLLFNHLPPVQWRGYLCIGAEKVSSCVSLFFPTLCTCTTKENCVYYWHPNSHLHHLSSWFLDVFAQSSSPQSMSKENKQMSMFLA